MSPELLKALQPIAAVFLAIAIGFWIAGGRGPRK